MDSSQNAYNEDTSALVERLDCLEKALFRSGQRGLNSFQSWEKGQASQLTASSLVLNYRKRKMTDLQQWPRPEVESFSHRSGPTLNFRAWGHQRHSKTHCVYSSANKVTNQVFCSLIFLNIGILSLYGSELGLEFQLWCLKKTYIWLPLTWKYPLICMNVAQWISIFMKWSFIHHSWRWSVIDDAAVAASTQRTESWHPPLIGLTDSCLKTSQGHLLYATVWYFTSDDTKLIMGDYFQ